jgi:hypothetical protein
MSGASAARGCVADVSGGCMSLLSVLLIGLAAWIAILVVVVAMCRAAARAEGKAELSDPARAPAAADAPPPGAILITHN